MPNLALFGWSLGLKARPRGFDVSPPSGPGVAGWSMGAVKIEPGDFGLVLKASDARFSIDGQDFILDTLGGYPLIKVGEDYRPSDGGAAERNIWLRMAPQAPKSWAMRLGPILLDDEKAQLTFDPADPRAVGLFRSDRDLASNDRNQTHPLSIQLASDAYVRIDLQNRRLEFPAGALQATLSAQISADGTAPRARYVTQARRDVLIKDIASKADQTFDFKLQPGAPAPLNMPPQGAPRAPLEVLNGRLLLTLGRRPNGAPGALVLGAALAPDAAEPLKLRMQGLRNSRNKPELWSTADHLPLAFRPVGNGTWSSPLIAPLGPDVRKLAAVRLLRHDDRVTPGSDAVLPLHTWFGQSQVEPARGAPAVLVCTMQAGRPAKTLVPWAAPSMQWRWTRPWLQLAKARLRHTRPGDGYRGQNVWTFAPVESLAGGLPLLARDIWTSGESEPAVANSPLWIANEELNAAHRRLRLTSPGEVHETGLADRTNTAGETPSPQPLIQEIVPNGDLVVGELRLGAHERTFDLTAPRLPDAPSPAGAAAGVQAAPLVLRAPMAVKDGRPADYAVLWPSLQTSPGPKPPWVFITDYSSWGPGFAGAIDPEAPILVGDLIADLNDRPKEFPLAILKVTRDQTIDQILGEMAEDLSGVAKAAFEDKRQAAMAQIQDIDPSVGLASFVGIIAFDVPVHYDAFPLLKALVPTDPQLAPRLLFLSVAPRERGGDGREVAISGSIHWENKDGTTATPVRPQEEATLRPELLSVAFRDRRMIKFHARARLEFYSFFGVKGADQGSKKIDIIGSARRVVGSGEDDGAFEIRFAAEVKGGEKLTIFPVGDQALPAAEKTFLKSAWLRRVEVVDAPDGAKRKAEVQIDGAIEFGKPEIDFGQGMDDFFRSLRAVDFSGLRISLPPIPGPQPRLLELHYPSLKFNANFPHIGLIGDALKLKFNQLIIDWASANMPAFELDPFPSLPIPGTGLLDLSLPKIVLIGRLDFGSLPDLFARSLSGFSLEGAFGLNFDRSGRFIGKPFVGMGGFGFSGLNFDLLPFITLKIDELRLGARDWGGVSGAALEFKGATFAILGFEVLRKGVGAFFSQEGDQGDGFWVAFKGFDLGLLKFDWGFVARNVDFPKEVPVALLTPPPEKTPGVHYGDLADQLWGAWEKKQIAPARGTGGRGWTFAASFSALGETFKGRALLQDGGYTGLALYGDALKKLLNWDFVFVGLYRKDITPGEDYFYFSVTLPPMTFGAIRFTGGAIAAEIFTSGDFTADLGFPWPAAGGGRLWERTLGAIVTPGQASGGFYVRKRQSHQPVKGGKELTVGGGVAIQWGLGAAFGGGVFQVWVRIGVYIIVEGAITLAYDKPDDMRLIAFRLQGAAGVLVEGQGSLDWWIISIRVGVRASAEIRMSLIWSERQRMLMPVEAELHVSAYAEACIGGGCARICRGISVSLTIPVRYQLEFG